MAALNRRNETTPLYLIPGKAKYARADLQRCSRYYNVNFKMPSNVIQLLHTARTADAQRILRILKNYFGEDQCIQTANLFFKHIWQSDGVSEG